MALLQNVVMQGTHAARPAAGSAGLLYFETDTGQLFRDSGSVWQLNDTTILYTAKGQLLAASASGAVGALGAGTNGYVLTADSTQTLGVKWASTAGLTQISSLNTNSGAAANIDFSSIAASYSSLLVLGSIAVASTSSADRFLQLVINADSGAHYSYGGSFWNSSTTGFDTGATSATKMVLGEVPLNGSDAGAFGSMVLWIPNYASTHAYKGLTCDLSGGLGATNPVLTRILGNWSQTSAITDLKFSITTGVNLAQFSSLTLYGLT